MFIGEESSNVWLVMACFALAFVVAAAITYIWGIEEE